jgi:serpin B
MSKLKLPATRLLLFAAISLIAGTFTAAMSQQADTTYPIAPSKDLQAAAADNNGFAIDLYGHLANGAGNLLFSPYSINSALAMAYAGARGQTATQMAQTMHFSLAGEQLHTAIGALSGQLITEASAGGKTLYQLSVADAVWTQQGLAYNPDFLRVLQKDYASELRQSDFVHSFQQARADINKWVAQNTADKIPNLLPDGSVDFTTRMILVNAIYFKGDWATPFEKERTADQPFHLDAQNTVSTPLMFENVSCPASETDDLQIVELPYTGDKLSMVILLPRSVDGMGALEKQLTSEHIDQWIGQLVDQSVNVHIPKFKMACSFELADTLKSMGIRDAFNYPAADFTGMTTAERLHISAVVHQALIDVNEEGTEAAAATGIDMVAGAAMRQRLMDFRADHPFIFLIRQQSTGAILFAGRVMNPKAPGA